MGTIISLPDVFNVKGKSLVTREALEQKFDAVRSRLPAQYGQFNGEIQGFQQGWPQDAPGRAIFLKKHFAVLDSQLAMELVGLTRNEEFDSVVAEHLKGKSFRYALNFRGQLIPRYAALHKKAELLSATKNYLAANPYGFSWQHVSNAMGSPDLTAAEKMGLLREAFTKAGPSGPMNDLLKQMANDKAWSSKPEFQALQQEYRQTKTGSDPGMRAAAALGAVSARRPKNLGAAAHAIAEKFLQEYQGTVPGDGPDAGQNLAEVQAAEISATHREWAWNTDPTRMAWAELWAPRLGPGTVWTDQRQGILLAFASCDRGKGRLYRIAPLYLATLKEGDKGEPQAWDWLSQADYPNDGQPFVLASHFAQMGEAAARFLWRQTANPKYNGPSVVAELDKLVNAPGFEFKDRSFWGQVIDGLAGWASPQHKVPGSLVRALLKYEEEEGARTGEPDLAHELSAINIQFRCGPTADALALLSEYLAGVKQRRPERYMEACALVLDRIGLPEEEGDGIQPGMQHHMLLKVLKPLYEQVPPEQWATVPLKGGIINTLRNAGGRFWGKPAYPELAALRSLLAKMTVAGHRPRRTPSGCSPPMKPQSPKKSRRKTGAKCCG